MEEQITKRDIHSVKIALAAFAALFFWSWSLDRNRDRRMFVIVGLLQLALFIGLTFNFPKQRDQILLLALILLWTLVYIIGTITGLLWK